MNKSFVPLLLVLGLLTGCTQKSADNSGAAAGSTVVAITDAEKTKIEDASKAFADALPTGDAEAILKNCTSDAIEMPPNVPAVTGHDDLVKYIKDLPKITSFKMHNEEVEGSGDLAYARGTYVIEATMPDGSPLHDEGKYIDIWRRQADGSWLMSRDCYNSDETLESDPQDTNGD